MIYVRTNVPYSQATEAMLRATAPADYPLDGLQQAMACGHARLITADNGGSVMAVLSYQIHGQEIEVTGLNAEGAAFTMRPMWQALEKIARDNHVRRISAMIERDKMAAVVEHFGMTERAVYFVKEVL